MRANRQGFTLTEMLLTVLIFGIIVGLFNTVFINNWMAYEDRIARANLWSEANQFVEAISLDGRNSRRIDLNVGGTIKQADFTNAKDNSVTSFVITDTGELRRIQGSVTKVFSTHAVFASSNFFKNGDKALIVELHLRESIILRDININTSSEVTLRN